MHALTDNRRYLRITTTTTMRVSCLHFSTSTIGTFSNYNQFRPVRTRGHVRYVAWTPPVHRLNWDRSRTSAPLLAGKRIVHQLHSPLPPPGKLEVNYKQSLSARRSTSTTDTAHTERPNPIMYHGFTTDDWYVRSTNN